MKETTAADLLRMCQATWENPLLSYVWTPDGWHSELCDRNPLSAAPLADYDHPSRASLRICDAELILMPHGTWPAYKRHRRQGTDICQPCAAANARHHIDTAVQPLLSTPSGAPLLIAVNGAQPLEPDAVITADGIQTRIGEAS